MRLDAATGRTWHPLPPVAKTCRRLRARRPGPGASSTRQDNCRSSTARCPSPARSVKPPKGGQPGPGVRGADGCASTLAAAVRRPRRPRCDRPGRQGGRFRGLHPGFTGRPKVISGHRKCSVKSSAMPVCTPIGRRCRRTAAGRARQWKPHRRGRLNFCPKPTRSARHPQLRCRAEDRIGFWKNVSMGQFSGKTAVVTGAASGIGSCVPQADRRRRQRAGHRYLRRQPGENRCGTGGSVQTGDGRRARRCSRSRRRSPARSPDSAR